MSAGINTFKSVWTQCNVEAAETILSINEIKDWWMENIGIVPDNLTDQLIKEGYTPHNVDNQLFFFLESKKD